MNVFFLLYLNQSNSREFFRKLFTHTKYELKTNSSYICKMNETNWVVVVKQNWFISGLSGLKRSDYELIKKKFFIAKKKISRTVSSTSEEVTKCASQAYNLRHYKSTTSNIYINNDSFQLIQFHYYTKNACVRNIFYRKHKIGFKLLSVVNDSCTIKIKLHNNITGTKFSYRMNPNLHVDHITKSEFIETMEKKIPKNA